MTSNRNSLRGLIIDPDPHATDLVLQLFRTHDGLDLHFEHATTLDGGLQRLAAGDIEFVLLDANNSGNDGLQTVLGVIEKVPELPIVVWSDEDDEELALSVVRAGAQEFLHKKQIDKRSICRCLRHAMERHRLKEKSRELESCDPVTGLPNRSALLNHLELAFRDMHERGISFAVLFLNLDGFKQVNESFGHKVGDQLLFEVGRRLQGTVRPDDLVARFAADEFTLFARDINSLRGIESIVRRLQHSLSEPFNVGGKPLTFSASIGIAISSSHYQDPDEILRDADTALHRAKSMGKARHQIFDVSMHQQAMLRLGFEGDLRRAIDQDEFELYYQPLICLKTQRLVSFEALIRWRRPGHGIVPPDEFISVAEQTGLIIPIGRWVLREGCRQLHQWQSRFPDQCLRIGVNVASLQISQDDLVGQVVQTLQEFELAASDLELEITESGIIENPVATAEVLKEIRRRGVRLSIDDFGTGYSSLSQLHRYNFDTLKVDRSFIDKLGQNDDNSLLFVKTIVNLAKDLGMDVVAEGIETEEQLRIVQELACEIGQGYLFSHPLDRDGATEFLERQFAVTHQTVGL